MTHYDTRHHILLNLPLHPPAHITRLSETKRLIAMGRPQNETMPSYRRSHNLVLVSAALLLSSSSSWLCVQGFSSLSHDVLQRTRRTLSTTASTPAFVLEASRDEEDVSWSRSGENESRFGVRRRVKKVLERAKNRTGIQNYSETLTTKQSSTSILAESASIGGLGGVLVDEKGTVDVALDLAKKNGKEKSNGQKPQQSRPEDEFVLASNVKTKKNGASTKSSGEVDAIRSDFPAAMANPEPLPFKLPTLTDEQRALLESGERIQEQTKMGRDGSGYVVVDVKAPPYVVWECLLDFESYTETIPTVRDVTLLTSTHLKSGYRAEKPVLPGTGRQLRHYGTPSLTRAAFTLSKFRLNIAAIHNYTPHPDGHYMVFTLDPACTNLVLRSAKGVWYTQANPDNRGEVSTLSVL